jgi:hypothetical protein
MEGAPRPIYDGITSILIRCSDALRFRQAKAALRFETDGDTIRWLLDRHPELAGPAAEPLPAPSSPVIIPDARSEPPTSRRGSWEKCGNLHAVDGVDRRCRRRAGHGGRHRWWDRAGAVVDWNHTRGNS